MGLFGGNDSPADIEQKAALDAIRAGGIPPKAEQRLRELRDGGAGFFTSDLSVDEFLLVKQAGLEPVSQVMGSCVYHVGWQPQPGYWSNYGLLTELTTLTEAWNEARERAFRRLELEAKAVGANAVVGVHMTRGAYDWAADAIEYVFVGTAVRVPGQPPAEAPLLSDLSGQDFWKLRQAGYLPAGIVGASSVFYVVPNWQTQRATTGWLSSWQNQELKDFTEGVYSAREQTMRRLDSQAKRLHADGIVGVDIRHHIRPREIDSSNNRRTDLEITFHVIGTAIRHATEAENPLHVRPVVHLNKQGEGAKRYGL